MLGQLFPRQKCAKRRMSTNNNLSFKSSKLKRKKVWWDRKRRRRNQENEKGGVRAQTIRDPNLRYFDLWREKNSWMFRDSPAGASAWGSSPQKKVPKYPCLSFSLPRKMMPILPQHSQMIHNILGALSPN